MPTIGDMSHGFDAAGVDNYLEEIKSIVLNQAGEKVKDITLIKTACEQNWEGVAREQFVANVQKPQITLLFSIKNYIIY